MIYALHGFLGRPDDWTKLLPSGALFHSLNALDFFNDRSIHAFWRWAERFNHKAAIDNAPRVLMGYSLGGRLAMHALILQPDLWDAAVIISAHGGLETAEERQQRCLADEQWAIRFENEPWQTLMQAWNTREVFREDAFNLDSAIQDAKAMQDFESESLLMGADHFQKGEGGPHQKRLWLKRLRRFGIFNRRIQV